MKEEKNKFDWGVVGNKHILKAMERSIRNKSLAGAFIFSGPDNLGKTTFSLKLAQILLCQKEGGSRPCGKCPSCFKFSLENPGELHGDFHVVKTEKEKKDISIEQIREFNAKLGMTSFFNSHKIGVIKDAHRLNEKAANALLKTLEEPKKNVIIILITSDIGALPATVVSRSQVLTFNQTSFDLIYDYLITKDAPRSAAKNFSRLSSGRPVLAVKFFEDKDFFELYLKRANTFLELFKKDVNERMAAISLLIDGEDGQSAVRAVRRVLEIWMSLTRDLMLMEFNLNTLVQHEIIGEKLSAVKNKTNIKSLINLTAILKQSKKYLEANVNPKLVLENIAINI